MSRAAKEAHAKLNVEQVPDAATAASRPKSAAEVPAAMPWFILHSSLKDGLVLAMDFEADTSPIPVHSAYLDPEGRPYKGMLWRHTPEGFLQNKSTGLVLTIEGHSSSRKVDVVCDEKSSGSDDPTQIWATTKGGSWINKSNNLCLTIRNGSTRNNGEVWVNRRQNTGAQKWVAKPFDGEPLDIAWTANTTHAHLLERIGLK